MKTPNKHNLLIFTALAGLILVIVLLIAFSSQREATLTESTETRQSVEALLEQRLPESVESVQDAALVDAAQALTGAPYIVRLWVVDQSGQITFHHNGPGKVGDEVRQIAGRDGRSLIAALSSDEFSGPQAIQIYTATALLVEGEHNDVFRPLVRPLYNADGRMVGIIGLSYEVNPQVGAPAAGEIARTILFLLGLAVYWLSLPLWTWLDARRRGEPAALWAIFVLVANLVGLISYLIVIQKK